MPDSRPGGRFTNDHQPPRSDRASDHVPPDPVIDTCVLAYASDLTLRVSAWSRTG